MSKKKELKIGLVGWNNKMNIGDDAMTSVIVRYFLKWKCDVAFYLFSSHNKSLKYAEEGFQLYGIKLYDFFNRKYFRKIGYQYFFPKIFTSDKDIILFGGGSIFHRKGTSLTYSRIINNARKKIKMLLLGQLGYL